MTFPTSCNKCPDAKHYSPGLKGRNADKTKLLLVLNRADRRITVPTLPGFDDYETALSQTQTGKTILGALRFCGLGLEDVFLTNVFKCLLPEDRDPSGEEYQNCLSMLRLQVADFRPRGIVAFGEAARAMFKPGKLGEILNNELEYRGFRAIALPHPSALWLRNEQKATEYFQKIKDFYDSLK